MREVNEHSLWSEALPKRELHAPLSEHIQTDVVIIGAGYTGLWTAYYLQQRAPELSITIVEAHSVGFGASGRNGGWCSALFPTSLEKLAGQFGGMQAIAMQQSMIENLQEIERVIIAESIDCDWALGGTISAIRNSAQLNRARKEIVDLHRWGFAKDHYRFLSDAELASKVRMSSMLTATYTPHCAAIHPAKLVSALANIVVSRGALLFEGTRATSIKAHSVRTEHGTVSAKFVVRATEGFTCQIKGHKRQLMPLYSLMLATEPLPDSHWDEIGLNNRETFTDYRNLIIYGQRTADNRIAFGGRGAHYHFGSRIRPAFDQVPAVHQLLRDTLIDLFPVLTDTRISHTWGGPLGVPRDWMPSVGLDHRSDIAWAGGYIGDGVNTSNLAGRTLADLITKARTPITRLPWVNHRNKRWEVEPLRWIGTNLGVVATKRADAVESKRNRASKLSGIVARLTGH